MAYALVPLEPVADGVLRVLSEQATLATKALARSNRETGVHDARKASKRCRALLRLVRPGLPEATWEGERTRYRDAAAVISVARDADVRLRSFDTVAAGRWPEARAALEGARAAVDPAAVEASRALWSVAPEVPIDIPVDALIEGSTTLVRRMRAAAEHGGEAEAVHRFRRRVKEHGYQLQLLGAAWPPVFAAMLKDADRLQEVLGAWHDLVILRAWLTERGLCPDELDARLLAEIDDRLHRAEAWAPKLLAMKPGAHAAWLRALWGGVSTP